MLFLLINTYHLFKVFVILLNMLSNFQEVFMFTPLVQLISPALVRAGLIYNLGGKNGE
jgi:hypothetical protein